MLVLGSVHLQKIYFSMVMVSFTSRFYMYLHGLSQTIKVLVQVIESLGAPLGFSVFLNVLPLKVFQLQAQNGPKFRRGHLAGISSKTGVFLHVGLTFCFQIHTQIST